MRGARPSGEKRKLIFYECGAEKWNFEFIGGSQDAVDGMGFIRIFASRTHSPRRCHIRKVRQLGGWLCVCAGTLQLNYAKINEPVVEQTNVDAKDTNKYVRSSLIIPTTQCKRELIKFPVLIASLHTRTLAHSEARIRSNRICCTDEVNWCAER